MYKYKVNLSSDTEKDSDWPSSHPPVFIVPAPVCRGPALWSDESRRIRAARCLSVEWACPPASAANRVGSPSGSLQQQSGGAAPGCRGVGSNHDPVPAAALGD